LLRTIQQDPGDRLSENLPLEYLVTKEAIDLFISGKCDFLLDGYDVSLLCPDQALSPNYPVPEWQNAAWLKMAESVQAAREKRLELERYLHRARPPDIIMIWEAEEEDKRRAAMAGKERTEEEAEEQATSRWRQQRVEENIMGWLDEAANSILDRKKQRAAERLQEQALVQRLLDKATQAIHQHAQRLEKSPEEQIDYQPNPWLPPECNR
jgi:hypothetical protein